MNCDRQLLSAYYDDELAPDTRASLEEHLLTCLDCQRVLETYRNFGLALSSIVVPPVPATLRVRFNRTLDRGVRPPLRLALVGPIGALAAAALVFVAVTSFAARSAASLAVVAAYPPNGATGVVLDDAIAVEFNSPLESSLLSELDIRLDPPVPVETTVVGSKVVLRPIVPLQPNTRYIVRIDRSEKSSHSPQIAILPPASTTAPLTVNFSTGRIVAAAASATAAANGRATAPPTPAPILAFLPALPATPTPPVEAALAAAAPAGSVASTPSADAVATLVSTRTPTPAVACAAVTSGRVAFALRGRPELQPKLGCSVSAERIVSYVEETRDEGLRIAVDDGRARFTLLPDGRWFAADLPAASTSTATPSPVPTRPTGEATSTRPLMTTTALPATATSTPSAADAPSAVPTGTPTAAASPAPGAVATLTAVATATPATVDPDAADAVVTTSPTATPTAARGAGGATDPAAATRPTITPLPTGEAPIGEAPTRARDLKDGASPTPTAARPSAPTATPTSTEPSRFAWAQVFRHGSVLLAPIADGGLGYVLFDDGSWTRLSALAPLPVATATAAPTRTPIARGESRPDGAPKAQEEGADDKSAPSTPVSAVHRPLSARSVQAA